MGSERNGGILMFQSTYSSLFIRRGLWNKTRIVYKGGKPKLFQSTQRVSPSETSLQGVVEVETMTVSIHSESIPL